MASSSSAPWTPHEIRQKASSWNLEGDAQLLELMQNISKGLEFRAAKTTSDIHKLTLDVHRTRVALCNVTNQLAALQHSQFVENRVYEDDETIANVSEVPVSDQIDNTTNYDPVKTLSNLLNKSMAVVEQNYEKVSIDIDDSDEEDGSAKSIIYRPKDPHENQPLPYIIGSKEWLEKWHIGICDSDEDFSGEEKEDEFSDSSESASMSTSLPSNAPTMSESEFSAWGVRHNNPNQHIKRRLGAYMSSEEDLSGATKEDNTYRSSNRSQTMPYNSEVQTNENPLANQYYSHQPKQQDGERFDESTDESTDSELYNVYGKSERTVPFPAIRKSNVVSKIFNDEPPPDVDVVDRLAEPSSDLFCESDGETAPSQKLIPSNVKRDDLAESNIRKKTVNLFDDDDFDSFMKELNTKTQEKVVMAEKQVRNLFEESESEEEANPEPVRSELKSHTEKLTNACIEQSTEEEQPTLRNMHIPNQEVNESIAQTINESYVPKPSRDNDNKKKPLFVNLFDDDPPEDDFDSLFNGGQRAKTIRSQDILKRNTNIFDFFDDEEMIEEGISSNRKDIQPISSREQLKAEADGSVIKAESSHTMQGTRTFDRSNLFANVSDSEESDLFVGKTIKIPPTRNPLGTLLRENKEEEIEKSHKEVAPKDMITDVRLKQQDGHMTNDERNSFMHSASSGSLNEHLMKRKANSAESGQTPKNSDDEMQYEQANISATPSSIDGNVPKPQMRSNLFDDESGEASAYLFDNKQDQVKSEYSEDKPKEQIEKTDSNHFTGETEKPQVIEKCGLESNLKIDDDVQKTTLFEFTSETYEDEENDTKILDTNKLNIAEPDRDADILTKQVPNIDSSVSPTCFYNDENIKTSISDQFSHSETHSANDVIQSSNDEFVEVESQMYVDSLDFISTSEENLKRAELAEKNERNSIFSTVLFSDVPPNDDAIFDNASAIAAKDTAVIPDEISTLTTYSQAIGAGYNAFHLFQDIPPDDDFDATPQDGKKLHNIFYDDFSETIIPSQIDTKPKSISSFIFDEPPPDSFRSDSKALSGTAGSKPDRKNEVGSKAELDSESKIASIIDRMQKTVDEPENNISPKMNLPPRKLNANLNINVNALLPGAKRPGLKTAESVGKQKEDDAEARKKVENDKTKDEVSKHETVDAEADPNMLQSLNKNRAKIQVKRRPSTRRGRQENYRRSLMQENIESDEIHGSFVDNNEKKFDITCAGSENESIFAEPKLDGENVESNFENYIGNIRALTKVMSTSDSQSKETAKIDETVNSKTVKPPGTVLFEDEPPADSITTGKKNKLPSLSQDGINDNDELFTSVEKKPAVNTVGIVKTKVDESKSSVSKSRVLLFEDESDNDDLFEKSLSESTSTGKLNSNRLYKAPEEVKQVQKMESLKVTKSIFGSDDDDEDLFGGGKKQEKTSIASKPANLDNSKTSQSRLFDDEDDDDDLFAGSGLSRHTNTLSSNSSRTEPKKSNQLITTNKNFEDPLADLFKD